jgi:hypothetical protein
MAITCDRNVSINSRNSCDGLTREGSCVFEVSRTTRKRPCVGVRALRVDTIPLRTKVSGLLVNKLIIIWRREVEKKKEKKRPVLDRL